MSLSTFWFSVSTDSFSDMLMSHYHAYDNILNPENVIISSCQCHHVILSSFQYHYSRQKDIRRGIFFRKKLNMAKSDSVTSPCTKAFCWFIKFPSIQSWSFKFKSINHTYIQYWGSIPVQNNGIWLWDGGNSEKVIVWHLSSTHFSISHHTSCDQQT